jgi:hypothetical protein
MLSNKIYTTTLLGVVLLASNVEAEMYAWSAPGDGRVYSWSSETAPPPPQFYSWRSPDGGASYWNYSTPGYSMWSYPPQFYSWSAPIYPQMYFYYPMYPYGGMYYYQTPPNPPK